MSNIIGETAYVRLNLVYNSHPELLAALNNAGLASWSVCPECRVDDFVHVDTCEKGKIVDQIIELQERGCDG